MRAVALGSTPEIAFVTVPLVVVQVPILSELFGAARQFVRGRVVRPCNNLRFGPRNAVVIGRFFALRFAVFVDLVELVVVVTTSSLGAV